MKVTQRIAALLLAAAVNLTVIVGLAALLPMPAKAADDPVLTNVSIQTMNGTKVSALRADTRYKVVIEYRHSDAITEYNQGKKISLSASDYSLDGALFLRSYTDNGTLEIDTVSNGNAYMIATINNVYYARNGGLPTLKFNINGTGSNPKIETVDGKDYEATINFNIDDWLGSTGSGSVADPDFYESDIVVENVILRDADGNQINGDVNKDSPAFTMDIIYTDIGLEEVDLDEFDGGAPAYLTSIGGFVPTGGTTGRVTALSNNSTGYPRFRARFTGIKYDGGSNSVTFRVQYEIEGLSVVGESTATVFQAKLEDSSSSDETPPPTPYIIVSQYSYGEDQIEAGTSFTLNITYKNTSRDIPLENIVMTITTPDDLSIASASNTFYIDSLAADAARTASIDLEAKPSAEVGSHSVTLEFTYEYLHEKERKEGKKTENIAIPVTQIDRFSVDPVTELTEVVTVGDEGYITISFINRGKSTTYNISASVSGNLELVANTKHFGNLEAGKSDTMDVELVPQEPGDLIGEVTITYEDENTNQKELKIPFTMYVDVPYEPPYEPGPATDMPDDMAQAVSGFTLVLCIIGGLLMAAPIALYLIKWVKARGIEALDEDF